MGSPISFMILDVRISPWKWEVLSHCLSNEHSATLSRGSYPGTRTSLEPGAEQGSLQPEASWADLEFESVEAGLLLGWALAWVHKS